MDTRAPIIGWGTGEPGLKNFFRVLGRKGRMPVTLHLLGPSRRMPTASPARAAHDAIAGRWRLPVWRRLAYRPAKVMTSPPKPSGSRASAAK